MFIFCTYLILISISILFHFMNTFFFKKLGMWRLTSWSGKDSQAYKGGKTRRDPLIKQAQVLQREKSGGLTVLDIWWERKLKWEEIRHLPGIGRKNRSKKHLSLLIKTCECGSIINTDYCRRCRGLASYVDANGQSLNYMHHRVNHSRQLC